ncbi:MAG TPA: MBL fold metallo-hydrolase [Acidimicrobiales bacterium]|nr:MBL fold metallo-hydrolase [Acidimicrobiales bacterium]
MIFEQFYLECLSQASYLIGDESSGKAVVVDPRRDIDIYLDSAREHGLQIVMAIETHFHADFLSGHLELAEATGAEIGIGAAGEAQFEHRALHDGERISLGEVELEIRETPGHTPESISIVVWDQVGAAEPYAVLTGDTLFIGDVGRPDLLSSLGVTAEELGRSLYDSLTDKILTLPDSTRVYPGHGAGSACGKNLSTDTWSTIGEQRRTNYALQFDSPDEFVAAVTEGQPPAPGYFVYDAILNRKERSVFHESEAPAALDLEETLAAMASGSVLIDTRDPSVFAQGHLAGAVNVGLEGRFAEYAGSVVGPDQGIILTGEPGSEIEARIRLGRIGFDNVKGYLPDLEKQLVEHPELSRRGSRLTVDGLRERLEAGDLQLVDVRNVGETGVGVIGDPVVIPVAQLVARADELDPDRPTVVYCAGGYRSSIATSLLEARGFDDVSDLIGGYDAWTGAVAAV